MKAPLNVLLAEDPAREPVRSLLQTLATVDVVAEASDGHTALPLLVSLQPDIALIDTELPGLSGFDVAERTRRDNLRTRVLMLSTIAEQQHVARALRAGAAGYFLKSAADQAGLDLALRAVAEGHTYLSPAVTKPVADVFVRSVTMQPTNQPFPQLSPRQHEILQFIAKGTSTRGIAQLLGLSVKTIETHRAQLMRRLNIRDVAGLVRYAIRAGIVSAE